MSHNTPLTDTKRFEASFPGSFADAINRKAVELQLDRILGSHRFFNCHRLSRFVRYTVEQALRGCSHRLKEYTLAIEVFDKPESFDPRVDSTVRVAARSLRARLSAYYGAEGANDEVLIRFSPGEYVPHICMLRRDRVDSRTETPAFPSRQIPAVIASSFGAVSGLCRQLRSLGHPVAAVVGCRADALTAINNFDTSLLLTECHLPGTSGAAEFARAAGSRGAAIIWIAPITVDGIAVEALAACDPHSIVHQPVRTADLAAAIALTFVRNRREPLK
jgi:hypothetical protein